MSTAAIVAMLIAAGVLNMAGTATVAINYARGSALGQEIRGELEVEEQFRKENPVLARLRYYSAGEVFLEPLADDVTALRHRVASYLRPRPLLVMGIAAYFVAVVLDTVAGVGALLR